MPKEPKKVTLLIQISIKKILIYLLLKNPEMKIDQYFFSNIEYVKRKI